MPQMPNAAPTSSDLTQDWTTTGPHVVRIVKAAPSTARDAMRTTLVCAASPMSEPAAAMPSATTIILFAPNRWASIPEGSATKMLASVNTDMSHEAVSASMENIAMRSVRMVGTLYWIIATATPATSSTAPTAIGLR